jgi:hypothetical protein
LMPPLPPSDDEGEDELSFSGEVLPQAVAVSARAAVAIHAAESLATRRTGGSFT